MSLKSDYNLDNAIEYISSSRGKDLNGMELSRDEKLEYLFKAGWHINREVDKLMKENENDSSVDDFIDEYIKEQGVSNE